LIRISSAARERQEADTEDEDENNGAEVETSKIGYMEL